MTRTVFTAMCLLALTACGGDEAPDAVAGCEATGWRQEMLEAVNAARASARACGSTTYEAVPAVTWSCRLTRAADSHSSDMATHNFFSHTGSDGLQVGDRVSETGYEWRAVGENIAGGQQTVEEVMQDWLESPGHCVNIMHPAFTELGAGRAVDDGSDFGIYWTQVFAQPR